MCSVIFFDHWRTSHVIVTQVGYDTNDCFHVGFLAPPSESATTTSPLKYRPRPPTHWRPAAAVSCTNARRHSVVMATPDRVTNGPRSGHDDARRNHRRVGAAASVADWPRRGSAGSLLPATTTTTSLMRSVVRVVVLAAGPVDGSPLDATPTVVASALN